MFPNYSELDDDIDEFSEASSEEIVNLDSEDDEPVGVIETPTVDKGQSEDDIPAPVNRYEYPRAPISARPSHMLQEKFGSLFALEGRPGSRSRRLRDDLEEGEIAMSGDAHVNLQQSGSSNHDHDENEDDHVLQPKIKWKRIIRVQPRPIVERLDDKSSDRSSFLRGESSQLPFQADQRLHAKTQADRKLVQDNNAYKHDQSNPSSKGMQNPPAWKITGKATKTNHVSAHSKDALEHTKARSDVKVNNGSGPSGGATMTEAIQRRGAVLETVFLTYRRLNCVLSKLKYNGVMDMIADVQAMLKDGIQYFEFSHEVRSEAKKAAAPAPAQEEVRSSLTHPGELVICKKKRRDRGPISPIGRVSSGPSQPRPSQSQIVGRYGNRNGASIGWVNPVKRTRTDAGKRRPSQL
nr:ATP-dependent helicase BRM [Tanacetum cinerariifolium]